MIIPLILAAALAAPSASYGLREKHPAVVNPVVGSDSADVISLRGEWDFTTANVFSRMNHFETHVSVDESCWRRKIHVPAMWEAEGVGDEGMGECWDVLGDENHKMIRHKFMGWGRYRKVVGIPADWRGKRIWLKVGGVKSAGWFYVNGVPVACVYNYCGTEKYEITDIVKFGEDNIIAAQVSNLQPSRKGLMSAMHRWGGIYRDVEIEATPSTLIDDAWVRGDFDSHEAEVHVKLDGDEATALMITINGTTETFDASADGAYRMKLVDFRPWSPENPNLYTAKVELVTGGETVQTRFERFGVRKIEVRGKQFYLNNRPFYIRGFGDDHVYPISGATVPDVEVHRAHLRRAHEAGFNFVRLHTHCEVPEYFEAADEYGILIQPELPYYNDQTCEGFEFDPVRDVTELYENYRRHPSFAVYSMGNEGTFGRELDAYMHKYVKEMDSDRLKINQDSHLEYYNPPESSDYLGGPLDVWPRGSFDPDRPFITHEYLNLCVKLDSAKADRYTGAWMPPVTRERRAAWLAKFGVNEAWGDRLQYAQHKLQAYYQKRGIETARADPYCDGHIFWTIVDVVVEQGESYSAQGLFDPFWETKNGGLTPAEFAVFNSPACVLADFDNDSGILLEGETLAVKANYIDYRDEPRDFDGVEWRLVDRDGGVVVDGRSASRDFAITIPALAKPVGAWLELSCGGVSNRWDFWLFPKRAAKMLADVAIADSLYDVLAPYYEGALRESESERADVVIAQAKSAAATKALERGQKVIAIGRAEGEPNVSLGWWWMGNQVGTALADSPVFGDLPKKGYLDRLFFRIIKSGLKLPLEGLDNDDIFMLGEGGTDMFLYLAQAKAGAGKLLMTYGLDLLSGTPEALCFLDGMIDYVRSDAFAPVGTIAIPEVKEYSGWKKTLLAPDTYEAYLPSDVGRLSMARGDKARCELRWLTNPVAENAKDSPVYSFEFKGGMGYRSEPSVSAAILLNGRKMVDIPDYSWEDVVWKGDEATLSYVRDLKTDELGTFTLTVPSEILTPNESVELSFVVNVGDSASLRWIGICEP